MKWCLSDRWRLSRVIILLVFLVSGCIGKPSPVSNYYLQATAVSSEAARHAGKVKLEDREIIALGPVDLPPELDRAGIVVKTGNRAIQVSRTSVWSGPLDELMAVALVRNLSHILQTDQVGIYPGPRYAEIRYQVELEVIEFSGDLETEFICEIIWSLSDNRQSRILARKRYRNREVLQSDDYESYVSAASRSLNGLSEEIAPALVKAAK